MKKLLLLALAGIAYLAWLGHDDEIEFPPSPDLGDLASQLR